MLSSVAKNDQSAPHPADVLVGEKARYLRVVRGMSQAQIADQLGISFQQVQKYEKGVNRISVSRLCEIAEILSVHPSIFFEQFETTLNTAPLDLDKDAIQMATLIARMPKGRVRQQICSLVRALST